VRPPSGTASGPPALPRTPGYRLPSPCGAKQLRTRNRGHRRGSYVERLDELSEDERRADEQVQEDLWLALDRTDRITLVDVWAAIMDADTLDEAVIGIYTTEELALSTAKRVSSEAADARRYLLNEVPDWIDSLGKAPTTES
jgi:hypothetical protein